MTEGISESSTPKTPKTVVQLLDEIKSDKRINGQDLQQLQELEQKFHEDTEGIYNETKGKLMGVLEEMLVKGFSVKNENDFNALKKVLILTNTPMDNFPSFQDIYKEIPENNRDIFSFVLSDNKLLMYVKEGYMNKVTVNTDEFGYIDLNTGEFKQDKNIKEFWTSFDDDLKNNNQFDFDTSKIPSKASAPTEAPSAPTEAPSAPTEAPSAPAEAPTLVNPEFKQLNSAIAYNKKRYNEAEIKAIQEKVGLTGEDIDGKIGPKTIQFIKDFQSKNQLIADGKVGPLTLSKMGLNLGVSSSVPSLTPRQYTITPIEPPASTRAPTTAPTATAATAPVATPTSSPETQRTFNYEDLKQAIQNYNNNETRFILPEGSEYFGDNTIEGINNAKTGFSIKRGNEDFRVNIDANGSFTTLNTTGINSHEIGEKAVQVNTGAITMKGNQFDLSGVLPSGK